MDKSAKKIFWAFGLVLIASIIYHALVFFHVLPVQLVHSDILSFTKRAITPGWIYLNKTIEYPVFIGIIVSLAGKIGHTAWGYYLVTSFFLGLAGFTATYFLLKFENNQNRESVWRYWVLTPSMFLFLIYNWDMLAVCFVVIAFYLQHKNKDVWAAIFLALGFITKIYPGIYLLPLLIRQGSWQKKISIVLTFLFVTIGTNIFFALNNFKNWSFFFHFSSERAEDYGTIWKFVVPLFSPYLYDVHTLNIVSFALFIICAGFALWKYRAANFLQLNFLITLFFLLFNKVFSPQYLLWLLPFFVLLNWPTKSQKIKWFYRLEILNVIYLFSILFYVYTPHYHVAEILSTVFGVIRLGVLIAILIICLKQSDLQLELSS